MRTEKKENEAKSGDYWSAAGWTHKDWRAVAAKGEVEDAAIAGAAAFNFKSKRG